MSLYRVYTQKEQTLSFKNFSLFSPEVLKMIKFVRFFPSIFFFLCKQKSLVGKGGLINLGKHATAHFLRCYHK